MRGESEKIWEFWAKSEKNKGNLPNTDRRKSDSYCILLFLLTATNKFIAYFCRHKFDNIHIKSTIRTFV